SGSEAGLQHVEHAKPLDGGQCLTNTIVPIVSRAPYAGSMAIQTGKRGRPRAITSDMLAEAACELFLEQGYEATNVAEIAQRAGIARSSFFNYAPGKAELLWGSLDERIASADDALPVR